MNISNFITWWIQTFVNLGSQLINKIDNIFLIGNVSLLDFIITLFIIEAFITIILTAPKAVGKEVARQERSKK